MLVTQSENEFWHQEWSKLDCDYTLEAEKLFQYPILLPSLSLSQTSWIKMGFYFGNDTI